MEKNSIVFAVAEVEYDAKRDEKEQHEAKMKEVHKVEELRKEKEAESKRSDSNDSFVSPGSLSLPSREWQGEPESQ